MDRETENKKKEFEKQNKIIQALINGKSKIISDTVEGHEPLEICFKHHDQMMRFILNNGKQVNKVKDFDCDVVPQFYAERGTRKYGQLELIFSVPTTLPSEKSSFSVFQCDKNTKEWNLYSTKNQNEIKVMATGLTFTRIKLLFQIQKGKSKNDRFQIRLYFADKLYCFGPFAITMKKNSLLCTLNELSLSYCPCPLHDIQEKSPNNISIKQEVSEGINFQGEINSQKEVNSPIETNYQKSTIPIIECDPQNQQLQEALQANLCDPIIKTEPLHTFSPTDSDNEAPPNLSVFFNEKDINPSDFESQSFSQFLPNGILELFQPISTTKHSLSDHSQIDDNVKKRKF